MIAYRSTQVRTLLLYAQDDKGLGHVTRTLTIARHILARHPNCIAYIATKSPLAGFTLPERCDYIKLPNLLPPPPGAGKWTVDQEEAAKRQLRRISGQILRDAALGLAPDLVLVDHEPLGSKGEFRDGLFALKAERPTTRFVCGLRDIQDDAVRVRALWQEVGVYDTLEKLYDGIAVYGSRKLYDVAEAYAIPPSVQSKLHYCGYNSVCEALVQARPLVIVPRATHRKVEQRIRAETLAARGLARWVHPKELTGERLAEAMEWALRCDRKAHARRVRETIPSFDGA